MTVTSNYTTPALTFADNGRKIRVVWQNDAGQVVSQPVTITVQTVPVISDQPDDVSALVGETATFSVVATGSPTPTYQWQKSTDSGSTWANISGATSTSYTTPSLLAQTSGFGPVNNDGEQFRVVVTNAAGSVTSNAATLTVSEEPSIAVLATDVDLDLDSSTTLTFTANNLVGYPAPSIDWQTSTDGGSTWASTGVSATEVSQGLYEVSFTGLGDANRGDKYRAVVTNRAGTFTSTVVTLFAYRTPSISAHPSSTTINEGQTAALSVTATGLPAVTYQWQRSTDAGSTFSSIAGATSSSYTTPVLQYADDETQYRVVVTNEYGTINSFVAVINVNDGPEVTLSPSDATVNAGQTATFSAAATGDPTPTVQWQSSPDGTTYTNITGATSTSYTTPTLSSADDGKRYRAVFTNAAGTSTTNAATVTVQQAPTVNTHPQSTTSASGVSTTFTSSASGYPNPTVQWQKSVDDGSTWSNIVSATSTSYTTPVLATSDDGNQYRAVFTNAAGTATSNVATLTIRDVPVITLQPVDITIVEGDTAVFYSEAIGYPEPTATWEESNDSGSTWGPAAPNPNEAL